MVKLLSEASGIRPEIKYGQKRAGDVLHSLADISSARVAFGYNPEISLEEGSKDFMEWANVEASV